MKVVIELEDSISGFEAEGLLEKLNSEPYVKDAYIQDCGCGGCSNHCKKEIKTDYIFSSWLDVKYLAYTEVCDNLVSRDIFINDFIEWLQKNHANGIYISK